MLFLAPAGASADQIHDRQTLSYFGMPGLVDMPTAQALPDAELAITAAHFDGTFRGTMAFQVVPSVTLSFRYSGIENYGVEERRLDRSFDVHWQFLEEGEWWPSMAVGMRDIIGTGLYQGEYFVATRQFGQDDQVSVSAGLGFGRFGERNGFSNPFGLGERPERNDLGGTINFDQFFRGDAAFFGGIEYQATDRLRFQIEYSSDRYSSEASQDLIEIKSPWNVGLTYRLGNFATLGAHYLYGTTLGISLSFSENPYRGAPDRTSYEVPRPLEARPSSSDPYSTDWITEPSTPSLLRDQVEQLFAADGGLELVTLYVDPGRVTIRVRNVRYDQESQALGRVLRILTQTMPHSIEVFEVIFTVNGLDASRVQVSRTELESRHPEAPPTQPGLAGTEVLQANPATDPMTMRIWGHQRNTLTFGIDPYVETFLFDPETPIRGAIGAEARARYEFGQGFVGEGLIRVPLISNLSDSRIVDGVQPGGPFPVRSQLAFYNQQSDIRLERLTLSHYGHIGRDFYSRVSVGYLERMFAGVSGELLWQPVDSRIGLGLELSHVWRRDFDGGFGLQDYNTTTGHISAYFALWGDFTGQVDLGRYLAGDYGGTLRVAREFENGWRVGAYATLTDVSFDEFGEGSFDKGIEITVPLSWFTGRASRNDQTATIQPVQRDGGARLEVTGRLHDLVTDYHTSNLEDTNSYIWR